MIPTSDTASATELTLLQATRLKGRLTPELVSVLIGSDGDEVLQQLADKKQLAVGPLGAKLTPTGRERLAELLAHERSTIDLDSVAQLYTQFDSPNAALKQIISQWQMRPDGSANDHSDADYDGRVITRLRAAYDDVSPLLDRIAERVPRLRSYPMRLRSALDRVTSGEPKWIANPMVDSYHQVWFELHEELINILGLVREDEAKSGRA